MKVLVIGATGTIGQQVTKLLEERGDQVVAASRKADPSIDIDDPSSIDRFFDNAPAVDAIICAAGSASFGPVAALSDEQLQLGINSKLLGQVNLVRKGLGKLNPGGTIVLTGGMLAYAPWPETANIAMVNAGVEGFVRAAALELTDDKKIFVVHPPLIRETAAAMGMDTAPWPAARTVAEVYTNALSASSNGIPLFVEGYAPG